MSRQLSDSSFFEDVSKEVPKIMKYGLQDSWLSKFFVKPNKVIIKRLDLEQPEIFHFVDKVEAGLLEQKITTEAMKAHFLEVMQEHRSLSERQAEIALKEEDMLK